MPFVSRVMMALFSWLCLILFFLIPSPLNSLSTTLPSVFSSSPPLCHSHERSALINFNNSFSIYNDSNDYSYCARLLGITNPWRTISWDTSRDCCTWSGVTCDGVTGHVVSLDLKCSGLQGILHSNNTLFSLGHLQSLILSMNYFDGSTISSQFGKFSNMIHLDLSHSGLTGQVPLELSYLSNLVILDLSWNSDLKLETSSWKRVVANLTNLRELFLRDVNMSYVLPNSFMNLSTCMTSLDLSESGLKGEFPENVFNLPNLQELDLSYNQNLTGSFPQYNWSSPIEVLNLSKSGFLIDLPYLTRKLKYLSVLSLSQCNFIGPFPKLLGNFTQITSLDLSSNNFFGQIPLSFFLNIEHLKRLDLSSNNFIGQIPEICGNFTKDSFSCSSKDQLVGSLPFNLKLLKLSRNELNGTIPSWLYSLPSLQSIILGDNQFTGPINEFQYNSLVSLDLRSNKLQGFFPRSIFQQVNLSYLHLFGNNLSGIVWLDQFSKMKNLSFICLSSNSLSILDSINNTQYTLPNSLSYLFLSSCGISEFPYSLRSLENLIYLDLSANQIEGSIPQWLWNVGKDSLIFLSISHNFLTHVEHIPWKNLEFIDLKSNWLQGHLPIPPPNTYFFSISNNKLSGEISSLICNLSWVRVLEFSYNNLSGKIPPCLGNSSNSLSALDLRMNKFRGIIPPSFGKENSLTYLNLNGNQLEGSFPKSFLNCKQLEILDIGNNKINGSFPHWLESLPNLQVLILRSNRFQGPISNPETRFPFQKLRILDLSNNEFTGLLPTKYFENFVGMMDAYTNDLEYMEVSYGLAYTYYQDSVMVTMKGLNLELEKIHTMFISIDFSRNNFTGEIPKLIGKLNSLKGLNFSHNMLTSNIPSFLGSLSNLEWLDLSSNDLVGKIPWQLAANLKQLEFLNLSNNKLEGPIPVGPQFNTFREDSYTGNLGLCGFPLSKSCSNGEAQEEGDHDEEHTDGIFDWKIVMMGYGCGLVIGISVGYIVLFSRRFDYWLRKRVGGGRGRRHKKNARLRGRGGRN